MEMWDIYSSDGSKTGEIIERKKGALKKGQFHLVVHIWFIDDKKRVLIQQRSMEVEFLKGKWAITGGCAVAGENEIDAAIRESYEEVGIRIDKDGRGARAGGWVLCACLPGLFFGCIERRADRRTDERP